MFPALDLARFEAASPQERRRIGAEVDAICRATGFLSLVNHGVAPATISAAWGQAKAFFALPPHEKLAAKAPAPGYPYGYLPPLAEALARSKGVDSAPDLKESFNGGPEAAPPGLDEPDALAFCYAPTIWPAAPGFRQAWLAYYRAMEDLAQRVMRVFAVALEQPDDFFAPFLDAPISALRALNYPALSAAPEPGQIRAGAHTDYGSLTILLPQQGSRGLEIFSPEGRWLEIPPEPGAFVINIGDLMARWTNDRWVSTLHRVVIPGDGGAERRQSFAFFHQPNWNALIEAPPGEAAKYPPVRSGPYLMSKFRSTTT